MSKIERSSAGLREALFLAIEDLRAGNIEAADGKAIAAMAREICNTVALEIEVAKLRTEYPSDMKIAVPAPLPLGVAKEVIKS